MKICIFFFILSSFCWLLLTMEYAPWNFLLRRKVSQLSIKTQGSSLLKDMQDEKAGNVKALGWSALLSGMCDVHKLLYLLFLCRPRSQKKKENCGASQPKAKCLKKYITFSHCAHSSVLGSRFWKDFSSFSAFLHILLWILRFLKRYTWNGTSCCNTSAYLAEY